MRNSMVSELGLICSVGKHRTGSMIELDYGHHGENFKKDFSWMEPVDESSLRCLSRRSKSLEDGQRGLITGGLILEQLIGTTSSRSSSCGDLADGALYRSVLPPSLARYILQVLKEKAGFRHSLTSLLPTERQDTAICSTDYEFRRKKVRCRSCEPQAKSSHMEGSALSSFIFDHYILNQCNQSRGSISPPRKRLSLSDSEICYAKDLQEPVVKGTLENEVIEGTKETSEETASLESTESIDSEPESREEAAKVPDSDTIITEEEVKENELSCEPVDAAPSLSPAEEEGPSTEPIIIEVPKSSKKKVVRFADDIGDALFQERIIINTSLPPTLHLDRSLTLDDDFCGLGDLDDSLPGVTKPPLRALGPKHNSMPDIMKIPPPLPTLHHSSSSNETLNLDKPNFSLGLTSPTNGAANWRLTFAQPAAQYLAFRQRLDSNYVSLENITLTNRKECSPSHSSNSLYLYGTIKVKNIAFEKNVKLRVTIDRWQSHRDYPAVHNAQLSSRGGTSTYDTFMFNFSVDVMHMPEPRELQFAVCFEAGPNGASGQYWDNNDGCNYVVKEEVGMTVSSPIGSYKSFCNHPSMGSEKSPTRTAVGGNESGPPSSAYTIDYRPNFNTFSSLTSYSSWQHYSSESMYY
ncbi:hypothetical protein Aperf_G00000072130 [Anoplocephala perfoliata]